MTVVRERAEEMNREVDKGQKEDKGRRRVHKWKKAIGKSRRRRGGVVENGRDTEGKDEVITRKLRRLGERKREG